MKSNTKHRVGSGIFITSHGPLKEQELLLLPSSSILLKMVITHLNI